MSEFQSEDQVAMTNAEPTIADIVKTVRRILREDAPFDPTDPEQTARRGFDRGLLLGLAIGGGLAFTICWWN